MEIDFGGYYEGDALLAGGLYSWIAFGGEDGSTIQFNIRFVEAPPEPDVTATIEVDGEQQQRELQNGDIIKVPYGSDSAVRISVGDFAEIEEQLIVTDNGGDISELVYDDGCWVIGFGNVSTLHNVAIYSTLGELESEVFYVKIIPVTESDFSDLVVAGSGEVVVSLARHAQRFRRRSGGKLFALGVLSADGRHGGIPRGQQLCGQQLQPYHLHGDGQWRFHHGSDV